MSHNLWPVDQLMTRQAASLVPGSFNANILRIFVYGKGYFRSFENENICYRSDSIPRFSDRAFKSISCVTLRRDLLVVQRANVR